MAKIDDLQKDFKNLTKYLVENMATKDDLKNLASKDDLKALEVKLEDKMDNHYKELKSEIKQVLKYAEAVEEERDKNEKRLTRVENHLGLPPV